MTHVPRIIVGWPIVVLRLSGCPPPTAAQGGVPAAVFRPEAIEQLVATIAL
jgi:hypothetical protein